MHYVRYYWGETRHFMRPKLQSDSCRLIAYIRKALIAVICFVFLPLGGCTTYRPVPLTSEVVQADLQVPEMEKVRVFADSLKHPLLQPISFDESDGLSPGELAILAVIANPTLRAVRDRRGIALAQLLQAGILPNPQLSYDLGIPIGGNTQGKVNSSGLGFGWDITSFISRGARLDATKAHAAAVDLDVAWQEWQVAEAARLHAYRSIITEKRLVVAKQAKLALEQLLEAIQKGVSVGMKTALDLSIVEARMQKAQLAVLKAQSSVAQERLALNRAIGFPPEKFITLENDIPQPILGGIPSVKDLTYSIEQRRLDLLALKLGYQSQEAKVRAAIRSQFPNINLGMTGSRDTDKLQTIGVGLNIELPFFDRNQGHIVEERATRKQLHDEYAARVFEARADIARLVTAMRETQKQIAVIDESLSVTRELADSYRQAAGVGQVGVLSYYEVLNTLYEKKITRIELKQRMIDLGIALEIASAHGFLL